MNEYTWKKLLPESPLPEVTEWPNWKTGDIVRARTDSEAVEGLEDLFPGRTNRIVFKVLGEGEWEYDIEVLASDGVWLDRNTQFQKISSYSFFAQNSEVVDRVQEARPKGHVDSFVLKYRVTKNDIKNARHTGCRECPQALAVARAARAKFRRWKGPVMTGVRFGTTSLIHQPEDGSEAVAYFADTPNQVAGWFSGWDRYQDVGPGEFEMTFHRYKGSRFNVDVSNCQVLRPII